MVFTRNHFSREKQMGWSAFVSEGRKVRDLSPQEADEINGAGLALAFLAGFGAGFAVASRIWKGRAG